MKVRVLGCSGGIARGCATTAFLVSDSILIDAGTGVGELTRDEMLRVQDIFLTHAHLDHIACLPLLVDSIVTSRANQPVRVHALADTIDALRRHIFNGCIWPDFASLPSTEAPFITFHTLQTGSVRQMGSCLIEAMPANHGVPAVGYAARAAQPDDAPWWVFSGDTGPNPAFWQRLRHMHVGALVIETAFSNRERELAQLSMHLAPTELADELDHIDPEHRFPIYITHTKPAESEIIMREIALFDQVRPPRREVTHDIRWLSAGHIFDL